MALFKREDGFFVGAILANVVTTELVILVVCFFFLLIVGANYDNVLVLLFMTALVFPIAFYHHSWSLWLGFDFLLLSRPAIPRVVPSGSEVPMIGPSRTVDTAGLCRARAQGWRSTVATAAVAARSRCCHRGR